MIMLCNLLRGSFVCLCSDSQSMLSHFVFVERDADDLNSNYIPSANIVKNEAAEDEILQRNRERPHTLSSTTVMDSEEPPSKIPSHAVMATQSDTEVDERYYSRE